MKFFGINNWGYKFPTLLFAALGVFSTYKFSSTKILISKTGNGSQSSIAFSLITFMEYLALGTIVIIYPYTLYSYVYKADWGILGASDTTPLIIISLALMLLIATQPNTLRKSNINKIKLF